MSTIHTVAGKVALALGKGIIAGLAGTAAITLAQMIEMKLSGRKPSEAPAKAVNKVLHIKAVNKDYRPIFVQEVHWTYGTLWGLGRSVMGLAGLNGVPAAAVHWASIWGTEMVMLPSINVAPPVKEWGVGEIAKDGLHHLVYAAAAGLVYDAID